MKTINDTKECNGWTNYPTWAAKLWIDNDEETSELAENIVKSEPDDYKAAESLKDVFEGAAMDVLDAAGAVNSMMSDLVTYVYSEVNWEEIAKAVRDDLNS